MISWDSVGYLASMLVLAAFGMKEIVPLRVIAIASNVAFLVYGVALGLTPVWLLHALLLPLNAWRLMQAVRSAPRASPPLDAQRTSTSVIRRPGADSADERGKLLAYPARAGRRAIGGEEW